VNVDHTGDARERRWAAAIQLWMTVGPDGPGWLPSAPMDPENDMCRVAVHAGAESST
jgi:hypothetical protein